MVKIIAAYIISAGVPLFFKFAFHSGISMYFITGIVCIKTTAGLIAHLSSGRLKKISRIISPLMTFMFAFLIFIGILITPFSAYRIWFEAVRDNTQGGAVSNLFVLLAGFFSSALSLLFFSTGLLFPVLLIAMALSGLFSIIYQSVPFYIASIASIMAASLYLPIRFVKKGNRLRSILSFFLFLILVSSAAFCLSAIVEPKGSRMIDSLLHPGLRQAVVSIFPQFPLLYGVPGFGYSHNEKRLGGTPVLSGAPIFEIKIKHGENLYLRTRAYDVYDSNSWINRETPDVGEPSDFRQLFSTDNAKISERTIRITLLHDYYFLLPHTLDTQRIILGSEFEETPSGDFDSGFILLSPLKFGDTIYLERGENMTELTSEDTARYLQTPNSLSERIENLAEKLGSAEEDPIKILKNIEMFLALNCSYNLKTRWVGLNEDFVENFLFKQREGYCVHFASAFIILARLNGIPSRYATGFLSFIPGGKEVSTISGLSAHAWPEIWLEGKGWSAWEATTAVNPAYYDEIGEDWVYGHELIQNRLTSRQLLAILGRRPVLRESEREADKKDFIVSPLIYQLILFGALAAFVTLLLLRRYDYLVFLALRMDRGSALRIVRKIVVSQKHRRVPDPEKIGWVRWAQEIKKRMPQISSKVDRLSKLLLRIVYGNSLIRKMDISFLIGFYRRFCRKKIK